MRRVKFDERPPDTLQLVERPPDKGKAKGDKGQRRGPPPWRQWLPKGKGGAKGQARGKGKDQGKGRKGAKNRK